MDTPAVEITESRTALVGELSVRRALPRIGRRTIGAWCFIDHVGPIDIPSGTSLDTAPHPHIGLQTVTWLLEGDVVHRDSLGSEQLIRPGELNLMTAGHGIVHSEEGFGSRSGRAHGVQLWVAQPETTRDGESAFEHHDSLPGLELDNATGAVLVGEFGGTTSPARRDTDHVGVQLLLRAGETVLPLAPSFEYGAIVMEGSVEVTDQVLTTGQLAYLGLGRDQVVLTARQPVTMLLIGGVPFEAPVSMFWNFVARTHTEIDEAFQQWQAGDDRFGPVNSSLPRIPSPTPPWQTMSPVK